MKKNEAVRIGIFGVTGKLGKSIARLASLDPRFIIAAALTHPRSLHLGNPLASLCQETHFPPDLLIQSELLSPVDILIDASLPEGLSHRIDLAEKYSLPLVIGTTGLSEFDMKRIEQAARQIPLFYTPNFSIGIAVLHAIAAQIAAAFPATHVDIIETHHCQKKDIPSGTALLLSQTIQTERPEFPPPPIHSLRSGQIIGEHSLLFNTPQERLVLSHQAHTRDVFAQGALSSALFLLKQEPGLYSMQDLISG